MSASITLRLRSSVRTVYTTGLCLCFMEILVAKWAGESTYLSAVLSTISGKALYFGQWQQDTYKISYSTVIGSCTGVAIGFLYNIIPLQLILLFICLVACNRCSYWDHLSKVIASLTIVLGSLRPHISGYGGSSLLKELLALIIVPFGITGITLLIPFPSLASNSARLLCAHVCDDLKESLELIQKTFHRIDSYELYAVKLEYLFKDIENALNELKVLNTYISNESIVFRKSNHLNTILPIFIEGTVRASNELQNCKKFLNNVRDNSTQQIFARYLQQPIQNLCHEIDNIIQVVKHHFKGADCDPYPYYYDMRRLLVLLRLYKDDEDNDSNDEENGMRTSTPLDTCRLCSKRLIVAKEEIFNAYQYTRVKFLFKKYKTDDDRIINISINDNLEEEKSVTVNQDPCSVTNEDSQLIDRLKFENDRLALRNLGPRMAFLSSLTSVAKIIASYEDMLVVDDGKVSCALNLESIFTDVRNYLIDGFVEFKQVLLLLVGSLNKIYSKVPLKTNVDEIKVIVEPSPLPLLPAEIVPYVQPSKIALSVIIASLFAVLPYFSGNSDYSIWSVVVICFIRSNDSASSFNLGYQRLEGTVIGSVFSFALFSGLKCGDINENTCSPSSLYPLILIWVGICVYFREGQKHGYSALVSSFTPIVILLNLNNRTDSNLAWSRIEQTLLGICIYLVVDNLILPIRVKTFIRLSTLRGIEQVRVSFAEAINAVRSIAVLNNIIRDRKNSLCASNNSLDDNIQSSGSNTDLELDTDSYRNSSFMEFRVCSDRLSRANEQLAKLHINVGKIADLLKLSANEPELFHKPFPHVVYLDLVTKFTHIVKVGKALTDSIMKLSNKLQSMSEQFDGYDDITLHLSTFEFFIRHILLVSDKSDLALRSAYKALLLLYEHEDSENNLDDIVTLARYSEKLLIQCDEHFRINYLKQQTLTILDPKFLLSWQNCFEHCLDLVQQISNLGIALLSIREVEAHNMKIRKHQ